MKLRKIVKFKLQSPHKACSFCSQVNIPVVMEIKTGKAICSQCIAYVIESMKDMPEW
jgi:hypothetical protein